MLFFHTRSKTGTGVSAFGCLTFLLKILVLF